MGSSVILPQTGQPTEGPDPNFKAASVPNIVTFNFQSISPPSPLYVQRDDTLVVKIMNSVAGAQFQISVRMLMPIGPLPGQPDQGAPPAAVQAQQLRGWINIEQQVMTPTSDRSANAFNFPLPECYLLSVSASPNPGTTLSRGQAFMSVGITRLGTAPTRYMQLISDDPAFNLDLGWPGGPLRAPTEGPGFTHSLQQANPAAGADWTLTTAAGQRLRISSFAALLTASAAAGNRQVELIIDDGANIVWRTSAQANVTASQVVTFSGTGTNVPPGVILTDQEFVIPPTVVLVPGWRIRTATTGILAGDQWSAIWFNVEEWINI